MKRVLSGYLLRAYTLRSPDPSRGSRVSDQGEEGCSKVPLKGVTRDFQQPILHAVGACP